MGMGAGLSGLYAVMSTGREPIPADVAGSLDGEAEIPWTARPTVQARRRDPGPVVQGRGPAAAVGCAYAYDAACGPSSRGARRRPAVAGGRAPRRRRRARAGRWRGEPGRPPDPPARDVPADAHGAGRRAGDRGAR